MKEGARPRVAVDANPAARAAVTGTEHYAREISRRLPAAAPDIEWTFYASAPGPAGIDAVVLPQGRLWSQTRLPVRLLRRRPDLLFVPSHAVPFLVPVPSVTTVHDLAFERYPDAYSRAERRYLRLTTRWAVRRCLRLIAVSEATRRDLVALYGADPERVVVVHPGGGEPQAAPAAGGERELDGLRLPERFALHVGRVEPRKNQLAALRAVESVDGLALVCAGAVADPAMAAALRASGRALLLGRVSDRVREGLYARAEALVFPSLHEGFGFPVLEALRSGLPVVTVRGSSLEEIGGDAVLYAEGPDDTVGLAAALRSVAGGGPAAARLRAAGPARAALFTWARAAGGVAAVIRSALPPPARSPRRPAPS